MKRYTCLFYTGESIQQLTKAQWFGSRSATPPVAWLWTQWLVCALNWVMRVIMSVCTVSSEVSSRGWSCGSMYPFA
jgi:hypothetical protein